MNMKSGSRLKIQAVSLLLAVTAVLTAGCAKADEPTPDRVDSDKKTEEAMIPLTAENLDVEVEKLKNKFVDNGLDVSFGEVKSVLLHLNKDAYTDEVYYSLFNADEYTDEPVNAFFKKVTIFNTNCAYDNETEKIVSFKDFCRNDDGYKVLEKLDESSLVIAKAICGGSDNIDKEVNSNLNLFYELLDNDTKIKAGNNTYLFNDLNDSTKTLIMYSSTSIYNYVENVCSPERLSDETKTLCNTIHMFAKVSCMDSYNNICNNIYNRG